MREGLTNCLNELIAEKIPEASPMARKYWIAKILTGLNELEEHEKKSQSSRNPVEIVEFDGSLWNLDLLVFQFEKAKWITEKIEKIKKFYAKRNAEVRKELELTASFIKLQLQ